MYRQLPNDPNPKYNNAVRPGGRRAGHAPVQVGHRILEVHKNCYISEQVDRGEHSQVIIDTAYLADA